MTTRDPSEQPDITVFRGWKDAGKHVWSPYVIKLEARLRFAGVRYATDCGSPKSAPKGKIPYVQCRGSPSDSEEEQAPQSTTTTTTTTTLGDSTLIIKAFTDWGVLPDLNAALSPSLRSHDVALRALLEDKLYFYHTWERWIRNYYTMRDHILASLPYPARVIVGMLIHRNVSAMLHGQGTARFAAEEIAAFRREIWDVLSALLVESRSRSGLTVGGGEGSDSEPFWVLGGEQPTEADACLFGFIVSVLICTASPDSQKVVRGFPILLDYAGRIHDRYFPDYEKWTE
ncbi:hypothetical protein AAE478_001554 [Parahypoxylon ruwenzoriense]